MNKERVLDITLNEKGYMYAMAERREQYVSHLHEHKHDSKMSKTDQITILKWAKKGIALSSKVQ